MRPWRKPAITPVVPEESAETESTPPPSLFRRVRASFRSLIFSRTFWLILAVPIALAIAQFWHRMADALGSRPVRDVVPMQSTDSIPAVVSPSFLAALSGLTETAIEPGHRLQLLRDGPTALASMVTDIGEARKSVVVQTYSCAPGLVMHRITTLLMQKAREGLDVLFLRDGFGCRSMSAGSLDSLRSSGVRVATIRPLKLYSMHRALHRSHVRSVIIDGRIGYTGGFGFSDKWIPGSEGPPWQETAVRLTGPAVLQLAGAVAIAWADATGEILTGDGLFPRIEQTTAGIVAGIMFTTRTYGTPVPERYLALSLAGAREKVFLANPYFIPNANLRQWLKEAAARGVDVRVLTASGNIDVQVTRLASQSTYEELLEGGVRIYEYTPAMLHAKTMVIDGVFSSVGSLNLDNVSLRINDEAVLLAQDSAFAAQLEAAFLADLEHSREIKLDDWRKRPVFARLITSIARLVRDFL